ncbi:toll/interleukin-1 receptor domain-containing protein [Actinokineospora diospyrosa]|uniref:TIR domain-containing protein n=1 Tax=Actinokineospora diospyrosa TaxID=103728 RepID=A0ABT1IA31_9PSEU|nr:toll/interleukin-1 receptor domain-containing protein [Actinokineospora diospyrosa]MCP2269418.1 TIR domain-containing protein [Actinokineospora diospyrosa]
MYQYDVFISYDRESRTVRPWVDRHLHPRLIDALDDNATEKVEVFYDQAEVGGAKWPQTLCSALRSAKVLVAVYSPKYFIREWCMAEWHSMAEREEVAGTGGRGLIFPVIYSDSDSFPEYATQRWMSDMRKWRQPDIQFQDSLAYLDFREAVDALAVTLLNGIGLSPAWQEWPVRQPGPGVLPTMKVPRY